MNNYKTAQNEAFPESSPWDIDIKMDPNSGIITISEISGVLRYEDGHRIDFSSPKVDSCCLHFQNYKTFGTTTPTDETSQSINLLGTSIQNVVEWGNSMRKIHESGIQNNNANNKEYWRQYWTSYSMTSNMGAIVGTNSEVSGQEVTTGSGLYTKIVFHARSLFSGAGLGNHNVTPTGGNTGNDDGSPQRRFLNTTANATSGHHDNRARIDWPSTNISDAYIFDSTPPKITGIDNNRFIYPGESITIRPDEVESDTNLYIHYGSQIGTKDFLDYPLIRASGNRFTDLRDNRSDQMKKGAFCEIRIK